MGQRVLRYQISMLSDSEIAVGPVVLFGRSGSSRIPGLHALADAWVLVETGDDWPDGPATETQRVIVVGTGIEVPVSWQWLASFIDDTLGGSPLVWHLFRVVDE